MNFETSPWKKATMAERAETLLISENKTLVRELACDGKFSVNQPPVLGEEVVIRVQARQEWTIRSSVHEVKRGCQEVEGTDIP